MNNNSNKYFIILFIILNLVIFFYWETLTSERNYFWGKVGIEDELEDACNKLFWTNYIFWFFSLNLLLITIYIFSFKKYLIGSFLVLANIGLFTFLYPSIQTNSIKFYYRIFIYQVVPEPLIKDPLITAGFEVGEYLLQHIKSKHLKYRRYAIGALGELRYHPSIESLSEILFDETEEYYIRTDAFEALKDINTEKSKKVIYEFNKYLEIKSDQKFQEYIKSITEL